MHFPDVVVTPFSELLDTQFGGSEHRGGPAWPNWESQVEARHCQGGQPIDLEPEPAEPSATIEDPVAWGGPLTRHFGHQVVDFSMRLLGTADAWPEAPIIFATHPRERIGSIADAPPFFRQMLDWLGVRNETALVTQPTIVRELRVVPQAEQHYGPGPSEEHLDRMDELVSQCFMSPQRLGVVYVSRAGQFARFAGEAYLEGLFRSLGATVVRPERLSLAGQLRTYAAADRLIFAEGSAMHGVNLLGRSLSDVMVINRRPGKRRGRESMEPRARSLLYVDAVASIVHGLRPSGQPALEGGLTLLDTGAILLALAEWGVDLRPHFEMAAYADATANDARSWLDDPHARHIARAAASRDLLMATLRESGLGHLERRARASLGSPLAS